MTRINIPGRAPAPNKKASPNAVRPLTFQIDGHANQPSTSRRPNKASLFTTPNLPTKHVIFECAQTVSDFDAETLVPRFAQLFSDPIPTNSTSTFIICGHAETSKNVLRLANLIQRCNRLKQQFGHILLIFTLKDKKHPRIWRNAGNSLKVLTRQIMVTLPGINFTFSDVLYITPNPKQFQHYHQLQIYQSHYHTPMGALSFSDSNKLLRIISSYPNSDVTIHIDLDNTAWLIKALRHYLPSHEPNDKIKPLNQNLIAWLKQARNIGKNCAKNLYFDVLSARGKPINVLRKRIETYLIDRGIQPLLDKLNGSPIEDHIEITWLLKQKTRLTERLHDLQFNHHLEMENEIIEAAREAKNIALDIIQKIQPILPDFVTALETSINKFNRLIFITHIGAEALQNKLESLKIPTDLRDYAYIGNRYKADILLNDYRLEPGLHILIDDQADQRSPFDHQKYKRAYGEQDIQFRTLAVESFDDHRQELHNTRARINAYFTDEIPTPIATIPPEPDESPGCCCTS